MPEITTHAQRAYTHLREQLIAGELLPGSRIPYGRVGKELGISATPVREAIGRLANEGFVDLIPQLGAVVRQISPEELAQYYEMREALEPYVSARAAERMTEDQIWELEDELTRMEQAATVPDPDTPERIRAFEQADFRFHMLLIEAVGNPLMIRTMGNQQILTRIFTTERHPYNREILDSTCGDHWRILDAISHRDPHAAREAMAAHIRHSQERTRARMAPPDRWWEAAVRT